MKLSDVVSALHLPIFAEVPLLIFTLLFLGVVFHIWCNKKSYDAARLLPLSGATGSDAGQEGQR